MDTLGVVITTFASSATATALVNLYFKHKLDQQLDVQRAFLQRQTKVHELQIQSLTKLYSLLHSIHAQLSDFQDHPQFSTALDAARDELTAHRLLIPSDLAGTMDSLFETLNTARSNYNFAFNDGISSADKRSELFDRFYSAAYTEIPDLLRLIEADARKLIHGEG
jgi:hypothetical protein